MIVATSILPLISSTWLHRVEFLHPAVYSTAVVLFLGRRIDGHCDERRLVSDDQFEPKVNYIRRCKLQRSAK